MRHASPSIIALVPSLTRGLEVLDKQVGESRVVIEAGRSQREVHQSPLSPHPPLPCTMFGIPDD
jgi:hypothetical protein